MKTDDFNDLIKSIQQAGAMKRGERKASRVFKFTPLDIEVATLIRTDNLNYHEPEERLWEKEQLLSIH